MSVHGKAAATVAALLMSTGLALAAPAIVQTDLNVRAGPGTEYPVVGMLPAGTTVDAGRCTGSWCMVALEDGEGFASSSYLAFAGGGQVYGAAPPAVYQEPNQYGYYQEPYQYGYYGGDSGYYGSGYYGSGYYGPGIGVGVAIGGGYRDGDRSWRDRRDFSRERRGREANSDIGVPSNMGGTPGRQTGRVSSSADINAGANANATRGNRAGRSGGSASVNAGGRAGGSATTGSGGGRASGGSSPKVGGGAGANVQAPAAAPAPAAGQ